MKLTGLTRYWAMVAMVAVVYAAVGRFGLMLVFDYPGTTPAWPPSGIAVAALLLFGYRVWPGVFLGALAVELTTPCTAVTALGVAAGNTLESLAGTWLANRFARGREFFERPADVLKFTLLVGMLSPLISPPLGVTSLSVHSFIFWFGGGYAWLIWWLGDMLSLLVLTPLLVIWSASPRLHWNRWQATEFGLLLLLLWFVGEAVFGRLAPASAQGYLLPYLCLPFLIWAALRFGPRGTATATFVLGAVALWGTLQGYGLFARAMPERVVPAYQGFIAFNSAVALIVAAVVLQRRRGVAELQLAHDELESRVKQRTATLQSEVAGRRKKEEELHRLNRTLNALRHSNETMMHADREADYLAETCRIITDDCGYAMVWIGQAENDDSKTIRPVAHAGFEEGYLEGLHLTWADTERGRGPTGTAIRTGKPAGCRSMLTDPRFAPWREEAVKRGYASSLAVPLQTNRQAFGAITIYSRQPDAFSEDEVKLLAELADDLAYGTTALRLRTAHTQAEQALRQAQERDREELERRVAERTTELRGAFHYARGLLEASLDPLVTISPEGKITDVNQATELVTGIPREQLIGSNFANYFTDPEKAEAGYQKVMAEGLVRDYPLTIRHASGRATEVLYHATVYRDEAGRVQGVFAAARDITERVAAEKRREITHALLELFAHKASGKEYFDAVVEVIRAWTGCQCLGIRVLNERGEIPYSAVVGFDADFVKLEGQLSIKSDNCFCIRAISQVADEQDRPLMTRAGSLRCDNTAGFMHRLAPEKRCRYRGTCVKWGFASLAVIPIRYRDQVLGAIHLADRRPERFAPATVEFLESMTPLIGEAIQRFHAEAELARHRDHLEELVKQRTGELEAANRQLRAAEADLQRERDQLEARVLERTADLSAANQALEAEMTQRQRAEKEHKKLLRRLADAQENERGRISRELHDQLGQELTALKLGLRMVKNQGISLPAVHQSVSQLERLADGLMQAIHRLAWELHPAVLDDLGLEAALRRYTTEWSENNHLPVDFHCNGMETERLPVELEMALYRIAQEALTNVLRHARAKRVSVLLERRPHQASLIVEDDGAGFNAATVFQASRSRGKLGLLGMQERITLAGGTVDIESTPGAGTTIFARIPLEPGNPAES